jgi:iron complex outermembrane recepter protein
MLCAGSTFGQSIKGKVLDSDIKEGVVGATIKLDGSLFSTSTDLQGNFSLRVPKGVYKLLISFTGYETSEVQVEVSGDVTLPDILLKEAEATQSDIAVAVGTRSKTTRTKIESSAPVDIITAQELSAFGQMDLNQVLQFLVPSFNSNRQSGSDIADHVDASSLRGLGPDQTLVLINGKRYHQSSLINTFGTRGRGNNGTDLNTIPVGSVERIEILRDGAAAQYGSDAIAGVINIVLKSSTDGFSGNLNSGIFSEGDGLHVNGNANYGLSIGSKGFLNITAEVLSKNKTFRPTDKIYVDPQRVKFGDASYTNSSLYLNSEIPVGDRGSLYVFGGISNRATDSQGFTVYPESERNIPALFPNGFEPRIGSDIVDATITAGYKIQTESGWSIDLHNTFGKNSVQQFARNTVNTSLGIKTPTNFDAGGYSLSQNTSGISFSKSIDGVMEGLNVAFGAEYRIDDYGITAGEEASWKRYITPENLAGGSQSFPGISPNNATSQSRSNIGVYADAELDITKSWLVTAAARYENYSDFGGTLNGKISSRYKFNDKVAIRGALSTGFRAPSLPQVFFSSTVFDVVADETTGKVEYFERLIANNQAPITKALGIPSLKQEVSTNISLGMSFQPTPNVLITLDGYSVNVKDRIVLTGGFDATDASLTKIFNDLNVNAVQFFANALDTRSLGFDAITTISSTIGKGKLNTSLAFNYNNMVIDNVKTNALLQGKEDNFLGKRERSLIPNSAPKTKFHLIFDYKNDRFLANLRFTSFSAIELVDYNAANASPNRYDSKMTTDFSVGYEITKGIRANLGGTNIFNVYPNKQNPNDTETGGMYEAVQMGFSGAFAYMRLNFSLK